MNFEQARFNMIEQQVRPWSVLDQTVLETMGLLPREQFAPESFKSLAYADIEIPLQFGESMMHPRIEGRMLQELEIGIEDQCLEIGTGSGYVAACMALMSKHVLTIDIHEAFTNTARQQIASQNISNVSFQTGNALTDLDQTMQYDVIAVTGSLPDYLPLFEKHLKPGGRLFVVTGYTPNMHAMKVIRLDHENFRRTNLFETNLKALEGVITPSAFRF